MEIWYPRSAHHIVVSDFNRHSFAHAFFLSPKAFLLNFQVTFTHLYRFYSKKVSPMVGVRCSRRTFESFPTFSRLLLMALFAPSHNPSFMKGLVVS
jgi:hypothetical protein